MSKKGPQGPLWHEIDVEKWFLDQYLAKEQSLKFRKFWVGGGGKIFEYLKRAQGPLWHEINVEKWFLDQYSAKQLMSKNLKIFDQDF